MSHFLKLGLGLIGIAAVGVGGHYLSTTLNTHWQPLSKDKTETLSEYQNKYGDEYKSYLTGIDVSNDKWWGESFEALKATTTITTKKFKDLKEGTDNNKTFNDLKNACKEAYKAEKTNVNDSVTDSEENKFKESEVWKFCSPAKTIEEAQENYDNNKHGNSHKSKLASTKDNDHFWKQRLEALKTESASSGDSGESELKKLKLEDLKVGELKDACEKAYKENASDNKYPKADVFKFCSLKGKEDTAA